MRLPTSRHPVALMSFMAVMNEMMNTLATIGAISGAVIRRMVSSGAAPLTSEASSSSRETCEIEASNMWVASGRPCTISTTMSATATSAR